MARILFGWELGANRGHISAMEEIAAALLAEGHEVGFAIQQIDAGGTALDPRIALWQAPLWPRLLASQTQRSDRATATMGEILCRLGLDKPGALASLIRAWDAIFGGFKPDLVVADFAPAMLAAARGRVQSVQTGSGFACPPPDALSFPRLLDAEPNYNEADILDIADADLHSVGRPALAGLPELFASDHSLIASFAELDPYRAQRGGGGHCTPGVVPPYPQPTGGGGEEIFVYLYHLVGTDLPVWEGLALSGRKVRVYIPGASGAQIALFRKLGFTVEANPLPFPKIAAHSRMALSHGGHGFVSACLIAGLPQVVTWYDLEKRLYGEAIEAGGFGRMASLFNTSAAEIAATIDTVWSDAAMAAHCRAAAPGFAARMDDPVSARVTALAAAL